MALDSPVKQADAPLTSSGKVTFSQKVLRMDSLLSMIVLMICGSFFLIAPATVYISLDIANIPNLSSQDLDYLQNPVTSIVRWSFFLTSMWLGWLIFYFFFLFSPLFLSRWLLLNYGYVSVRAERLLDYIPQVFYQLTWAAWFILASIVYSIIFVQYQLVYWWATILQIILMCMVFSICLLVQRIIVQKIASDFNKIAYNERLQKSKREMKLIDKLRRCVKKFGVLDLLGVEQFLQGSAGGNSVKTPNRPSLEYLAPNQGGNTAPSLGDSSQRKRSAPNIVHFFNPSKSNASSSPPTGDNKEILTPARVSLTGRVDGIKSIESPAAMSDNNIRRSTSNASANPKNRFSAPNADSQIVVLLPDNQGDQQPHSPVEVSPLDHISEGGSSPRRKKLDRDDTAHSDKQVVLEQVTIGGIKKKDRILDISGDYEAQKLAQKVWSALKQKSSAELTLSNFFSLFPLEEEAREMFDLLDTDKNGKLSFEEIRGTMQMIYKEKRDLHFSLNDLSHALGHLNWILYGFSAFVTLLISLPIYGISLNAILPFTSFFLALSFIFGGAAKTAFDCIVFLFVRHPYDSGDRVIIDDKTYAVLELSLLETVLRSDGKICYYPNGYGNYMDNLVQLTPF